MPVFVCVTAICSRLTHNDEKILAWVFSYFCETRSECQYLIGNFRNIPEYN